MRPLGAAARGAETEYLTGPPPASSPTSRLRHPATAGAADLADLLWCATQRLSVGDRRLRNGVVDADDDRPGRLPGVARRGAEVTQQRLELRPVELDRVKAQAEASGSRGHYDGRANAKPVPDVQFPHQAEQRLCQTDRSSVTVSSGEIRRVLDFTIWFEKDCDEETRLLIVR
jgi:hypothetical protein